MGESLIGISINHALTAENLMCLPMNGALFALLCSNVTILHANIVESVESSLSAIIFSLFRSEDDQHLKTLLQPALLAIAQRVQKRFLSGGNNEH